MSAMMTNTQQLFSTEGNCKKIPPMLSDVSQQCNADMINDDLFLDRELSQQDWMRKQDATGLSSNNPSYLADPLFILQEQDDILGSYPLPKPANMNNLIDQQSKLDDSKIFLDYLFELEEKEMPSACLLSTKEKTADQQQSMKIPMIPMVSDKGINNGMTRPEAIPHIREYQGKQWDEQYHGLLKYIKKHGHCCVPNKLDENPRLGRWVKRQRYQYKLLQQGKMSTLTASRVESLEEVGFVWDSHAALWVERLNELKEFRKAHGHCNVPSAYPENVQLSTWVKCQRRQYKVYTSDQKRSNLNAERIVALEKLGFEWDGRLVRSSNRQSRKLIWQKNEEEVEIHSI